MLSHSCFSLVGGLTGGRRERRRRGEGERGYDGMMSHSCLSLVSVGVEQWEGIGGGGGRAALYPRYLTSYVLSVSGTSENVLKRKPGKATFSGLICIASPSPVAHLHAFSAWFYMGWRLKTRHSTVNNQLVTHLLSAFLHVCTYNIPYTAF